jgi:hypothetical protein
MTSFEEFQEDVRSADSWRRSVAKDANDFARVFCDAIYDAFVCIAVIETHTSVIRPAKPVFRNYMDDTLVDFIKAAMSAARHFNAPIECEFAGRRFQVTPSMSFLDVVSAFYTSSIG